MLLIIQICIASFWWYIGIQLLFREAVVWATVGHIPWFRKIFHCSSTRKWERFCREAGLLCFATGGLLFISLPFGMGIFGLFVALPPLIFLL